MKQIPITRARDQLNRLVREVEEGSAIELTRHGKRVAVLVCSTELEQPTPGRARFSEAFDRFRRDLDPDLDLAPYEVFADWRTRDPC